MINPLCNVMRNKWGTTKPVKQLVLGCSHVHKCTHTDTTRITVQVKRNKFVHGIADA